MKDVKTIISKEKEEFENKIKEYLENGYKILSSNIAIEKPIQVAYSALINGSKFEYVYYALLIKEE